MSTRSSSTGCDESSTASQKQTSRDQVLTPTPAPPEWKILKTQVGGHKFAHEENEQHQKLGMVDFGNGMVLKSLQNPPRGIRELSFYQRAFDPDCDDADILELRPFLPPFYGTEEKGSAKFLKLANLTSGFKQPCVIDLKMGKVTYDQEATPEKIEHEVSKYPPLKDLGFQITGMMIYNPDTQSAEHYGRSYCRNLAAENIVSEGLGLFFRLNSKHSRRDAIPPLISQLKKLEHWFLKQKKLSFIASSLLIVYEGSASAEKEAGAMEDAELLQRNDKKNVALCDKSTNNLLNVDSPANTKSTTADTLDCNSDSGHIQKRSSNKPLSFTDETVKKIKLNETGTKSSDLTQHEISTAEQYADKITNSTPMTDIEVHLIDFAHVFPANDIDHNFLFGLQKLISCLQTLLK
ncbi:unnamed protein product [Candidula unifasciata]|uniref:Kinase n=1 Tax=Candidula unifasciata TaxID=100452 RepID=A0A8S3Z4F3_9EUPU|nr:unnamed protein product [Candidula unifasciata]